MCGNVHKGYELYSIRLYVSDLIVKNTYHTIIKGGFMGLIAGVALIVSGILASSSTIIKKRPEAKELIAKLVPWQGWIGLIVCLWGIWGTIHAVLTIGLIASVPVWWLTYLVANVSSAAIGFLLGYGMIQRFALKNAEQDKQEKAEKLHEKLVGIQIPLGYVALVIGVWSIIANFIVR